MPNLEKFYRDPKNINTLIDIIESKSELSRRVLDWFVTNYSKKFIIILNQTGGGGFNVYQNYKLQLKSYSKCNFDPFCRKDKILFYYTDDKFIQTSCGQLCFFRWCIQNNILDYVVKNLDTIEKDMKSSKSNTKSAKSDDDILHKRKSLNASASRGISKYKIRYEVTF
jgi:hypothetical protein